MAIIFNHFENKFKINFEEMMATLLLNFETLTNTKDLFTWTRTSWSSSGCFVCLAEMSRQSSAGSYIVYNPLELN